MTNSGFLIPADIGAVVSERTQIWKQIDDAQSQFNDMEKQAAQFSSITPAPIPSELSTESTPPAEVAMAVKGFRDELTQIGKHQEEIKAHQAEIAKIKSQQTTTFIIAGIVIAIVLCFVVFGGMGIINSISR